MLHRKVSTIDIQVGSRIRAARLANRVSQQKLGRAIGVKAPQIHKYECGTNRVAPGRLHEIANYLGVAASYFFEDLGSPPATPIRSVDPVTSVLTSKEGARIARALLHIDDSRLLRRLADLIETIADEYDDG